MKTRLLKMRILRMQNQVAINRIKFSYDVGFTRIHQNTKVEQYNNLSLFPRWAFSELKYLPKNLS